MRNKSKVLSGRILNVLSYLSYTPNPSIREIGSACGISSTSVTNYYLDRLESLGYILRAHKKARSIVFTPEGVSILGLGDTTICKCCGRPAFMIVHKAELPVKEASTRFRNIMSSVSVR